MHFHSLSRFIRSRSRRLLCLDQIAAEKQRSDLLASELHHRMKNLFAVIQSIISATARTEDDPEMVSRKACERINALAQAHALANQCTASKQTRPRSVFDLIQAVAKPYAPHVGSLECKGDQVPLRPEMLTPLSLVINELATNATKYGAWRGDSGRVTIEVAAQPGTSKIKHLSWIETGGPPFQADTDTEEGFGTQMLNASVSQLRGALTRSWNRSGLRLTIEFA